MKGHVLQTDYIAEIYDAVEECLDTEEEKQYAVFDENLECGACGAPCEKRDWLDWQMSLRSTTGIFWERLWYCPACSWFDKTEQTGYWAAQLRTNAMKAKVASCKQEVNTIEVDLHALCCKQHVARVDLLAAKTALALAEQKEQEAREMQIDTRERIRQARIEISAKTLLVLIEFGLPKNVAWPIVAVTYWIL